MRALLFAVAILLAVLPGVRAQTAGTELFLKPEDVGAHKYVWQVTPQQYVYNVYVDSYANLKQRYPDVPPLEELRTTAWASHAKP